ncbi:MFS transporter [Rossellomorea aquimaris]|uniref:MFS transporter n=1 Tax=Rossellomorea aquimaris TaxID=189382 RepID=UPI0007D098E3|nr:MFS transporter [Rossellomorea aquimaris]
MKWFIWSQSFAMMAASVSFPFYLLFIQNIGRSFTSFGFAYGLFTLSAAVCHLFIGRLADRIGGGKLLVVYSFGMSLLFLFIPVMDSIIEVYIIQVVLGLLGALQKTSEKIVISDVTERKKKGVIIGNYHFCTSLLASAAVMGTGFLIDYFTITIIFYGCSIFFLLSGLILVHHGSMFNQSVAKES